MRASESATQKEVSIPVATASQTQDRVSVQSTATFQRPFQALISRQQSGSQSSSQSQTTGQSSQLGLQPGSPVKVLALGDIEGFSPGYLVVTQEGRSAWVPIEQIDIVDGEVLPVAKSHYDRIASSIGMGTSMSSSGSSSGQSTR